MLLLDIETQQLREVSANSLQDYYKLIDCDLVEIHEVSILNKDGRIMKFDVICDEEGKNKQFNLVSSMNYKDKSVAFVGNLLICKNDGLGNERSLSKLEKAFVKDSLFNVPFEAVDEESKLIIKTNLKCLGLYM